MAPPLLPVTLLLLHLLAGGNSAATPSPNPTPADFILTSCSTTLYPQLCYTSLQPYAAAIRRSPLALAVAAANVSLAKIKDASSTAATLRRGCAAKVAGALRDCVDSLRTAAKLTKDSVGEIKKLDPAARDSGSGVAWGASNAMTWMSAAMTNEDTCVDGFEDIGATAGKEGKAVCGKVGRVKQYTSNALALLNALVNGMWRTVESGEYCGSGESGNKLSGRYLKGFRLNCSKIWIIMLSSFRMAPSASILLKEMGMVIQAIFFLVMRRGRKLYVPATSSNLPEYCASMCWEFFWLTE